MPAKFPYPSIPTLCPYCNEIVWKRGRKYCRGHNGHTAEINKKRSEKLIGRTSPMKNKHHTEEAKKILSEKHKQIGAPWLKNKPSNNKGKLKGRTLTNEHKAKCSAALIKLNRKGNAATNWHGGVSFLPYCEKWTKELRETVRERDRHICQLCEIKQEDLIGRFKKLAVHHVHYDKENCYPDLITLCHMCNLKVNSNRNYYQFLFMNKLNDRELLFWTISLYKEKIM